MEAPLPVVLDENLFAVDFEGVAGNRADRRHAEMVAGFQIELCTVKRAGHNAIVDIAAHQGNPLVAAHGTHSVVFAFRHLEDADRFIVVFDVLSVRGFELVHRAHFDPIRF